MGRTTEHRRMATTLAPLIDEAIRLPNFIPTRSWSLRADDEQVQRRAALPEWLAWLRGWLARPRLVAAVLNVSVPLQSEATCGLHTLMYAAAVMDQGTAIPNGAGFGDHVVYTRYLPRFIQLLAPRPLPSPPIQAKKLPSFSPSPLPVQFRESLASFIRMAYRLLRAHKSPESAQWDTIGGFLRDLLQHEVNQWPEKASMPPPDPPILHIWLDVFRDHPAGQWVDWVQHLEDEKRDAMVESMLKAFVVQGQAMNRAWAVDQLKSPAYLEWVQRQVEQLVDLQHWVGMDKLEPSLIEQTWFCCRCFKRTTSLVCRRTGCRNRGQ
jgi:hypothetical protein